MSGGALLLFLALCSSDAAKRGRLLKSLWSNTAMQRLDSLQYGSKLKV